ncbi:putative ribose-5-phosphate isomerase 4, chloroplastic [Capsicum chacoense]
MAMALALPSSASSFLSSSSSTTQKQAYFTSSRKSLHRFVIRSTLSDPSAALFLASKHAVDSYVKSGMVVGLGSGHASALAIHYLGQQLRAGTLKDVTGIPTCVGSASEAAKAGIPLEQYDDSYKIDLAFDEADIMEEETLAAIIGRRKLQGDDSIIKEKTILDAADQLIFIIKEKQFKGSVEGSIPVLIKSVNWLETAEEIDDLFLGDAEVWRRPAIGYAGPLGGDFPLVTKEGHNILDVIFTSPIESLGISSSLNYSLPFLLNLFDANCYPPIVHMQLKWLKSLIKLMVLWNMVLSSGNSAQQSLPQKMDCKSSIIEFRWNQATFNGEKFSIVDAVILKSYHSPLCSISIVP